VGSEASRQGLGVAVEAALGGSVEAQGDPAFEQSCHAYGHVPACSTWIAHLRRLDRERTAAGGEAELKAACGYWSRVSAQR
jgi:hypothetical protein